MAWRIADSVTKGEIDNRTRDRVVGKIWVYDRDEPVTLELTGNPHRDLAGQYLRFVNPAPKPLPEHLQEGFAEEQTGAVGDMTAARKVKILDIPDDEFEHYYRNKIPMPYHWGNCLYLEWHSVRNGRVVIEATDYELTVEPEAAWQMSEEEEKAQHESNARAMTNFMDTLLEAAAAEELADPTDEDTPQSEAEAEADAEAARMDLLNDRIQARIEKEEHVDAEAYERIMEEERERLRRERGEPEPEPLTPEEEAERDEWIAEINAAAEEALAKEGEPAELQSHPLVDRCHELGSQVRADIEQNQWLPEGAHQEHPLHELVHGIWFASAKLAGALNGDPDDWPPDALIAGNTLVRLKKARGYLTDALAGLDSAEAEKLCAPSWLTPLRQELQGIQKSVQGYITEVRTLLRRTEDEAS